MLASPSIQASDPNAVTAVADGAAESRKTIAVLDELLCQSIHLRDLYRNARWQTAAHESVLSAVRPNDSVLNRQWAHDFAVGQVVLTNDSQSLSIIEQLAELEPAQRSIGPRTGARLDYE